MTCSILHHRELLDQTEWSNSTSLYQSSQEVQLKSKDRMRFLCIVTLEQDKERKEENMRRERNKQKKDKERPVIERVLMVFLNSRSG